MKLFTKNRIAIITTKTINSKEKNPYRKTTV